MRTRSVALSSALAGALFVLGQGVASANVVWCIADPPVQVISPSGQTLTVNSSVYLPLGAQHLKSLVTEQATAVPDGGGGTLIIVQVHVPEGIPGAEVVASENRFGVTDSQYGEGGTTVTLHLDVPAA